MLGLSETPVHRVNATSEKVNNKLLTHDVFHNGSEHTQHYGLYSGGIQQSVSISYQCRETKY